MVAATTQAAVDRTRVALNKDKIRAAAQKYLQKGQIDKAIREYQRLVEDDPKDVRTLLKLGDLQTRAGDNNAATTTYNQVAQFYSEQGFFLKAVAVYKQILKLDPSLIEVNVRLAELYHQLGLLSDATNQYRQLCQLLEMQGRIDDSIGILKKMVELDPDNVASRIKLAELYAKQSMQQEAKSEFSRAAAFLKQHHRVDDYAKVAERIVFFDPADLATTRELANIYIQKGDARRALAKLQVCFKANPRDVETLTLLANAFRDLGQVQKTLSVYRELARVHHDEGDESTYLSVVRKILELAPDDAEAAQVLAQHEPQKAAVARIVPSQRPAKTDESVVEVDRREPQPEEPQEGAEEPRDVTAENADAIARLLVETDIYVKYGLAAKAIEHIRRIFAIDPTHRQACEKHKHLLLEAGNLEGATRQLLAMAETAYKAGDLSRARDDLEELLGLDPDHAGARQLLNQVAPDTTAGDEVVVEGLPEEILLEAGAAEEVPAVVLEGQSGGVSLSYEPSAEAAGIDLDADEDGDSPAQDTREAEGAASFEANVTIESENAAKPVAEFMPEAVFEPEPELGDELTFEPQVELEPEATFEPEAELEPETTFEPQAELEPEATFEPEAEVELEATFEPRAELEPEATFEPEAELELEATFEPQVEMEPEATFEPRAELEPEATFEPEAELEPEATFEPEAELEPEATFEPQAELHVEATFGPPAQVEEPTSADVEPDQSTSSTAKVAEAGQPKATAGKRSSLDDDLAALLASAVPTRPNRAQPTASPASATKSRQAPAAVPNPPPAPQAPKVAPTPEPAAATSADAVDLSDEIEEIEFYLQQGLDEEAKDSFENLIATYPNHPDLLALKERFAPAEASPAPAPAPAEPTPAAVDEDFEPEPETLHMEEISLTTELAAELEEVAQSDDFQVSFTDVFDEFKKGVARQVDDTDYETHFNLGIAYKEMGLYDDAIREFALAERSPERQIGALTMVGLVELERGNTRQALDSFLRGLNSEYVTAVEAVALRYEIGQAYEAMGRPADAYKFFEKVRSMDETFRDVGARLEHLRGQQHASSDSSSELDELLEETAAEKAAQAGGKISYL